MEEDTNSHLLDSTFECIGMHTSAHTQAQNACTQKCTHRHRHTVMRTRVCAHTHTHDWTTCLFCISETQFTVHPLDVS